MEQMDKLLLSFAETCETLGICRNTLYELIELKKIRGFQVGRNWKFPVKELNRYIDEEMSTQMRRESAEGQAI